MKRIIFLCIAISTLFACGNHNPTGQSNSYLVLKSIYLTGHSVQIYAARGYDVAFVGVGIQNSDGTMQYCPMYGSPFEGLPAVILTASVIDSRQQLWLESSWKGYEVLGLINVAKPSCTTRYGEVAFEKNPVPEGFGGSRIPFPIMDKEKVSNVYTIQYGSGN